MATLYSELLHGVLCATTERPREGVQIITVASILNVNSCIVFISGGTVDDKLSMQKQLVIEAWYMAISTTTTK